MANKSARSITFSCHAGGKWNRPQFKKFHRDCLSRGNARPRDCTKCVHVIARVSIRKDGSVRKGREKKLIDTRSAPLNLSSFSRLCSAKKTELLRLPDPTTRKGSVVTDVGNFIEFFIKYHIFGGLTPYKPTTKIQLHTLSAQYTILPDPLERTVYSSRTFQ